MCADMKWTNRTYTQALRLSLFALALCMASNAMASFFGKSELSGVWKERFQDVNKLNEYTQKGFKVELSDYQIKGYKLTGAVMNNASFEGVEWDHSSLKSMTLTNARFLSNTFTQTHFSASKLTNVVFENSEFDGVSFYEAQLSGVKFIHCKFKNHAKANFMYLKDSNIEFENTIFESDNSGPPTVTFAESTANLTFRNSELTNIEMTDLILPSSLTFENSKLDNVDWSRSNLTKLILEKTVGGAGGDGGGVAEIEVRDSSVGFTLTSANLGKLSFVNSMVNVNFVRSTIKGISMVNCTGMEDFTISGAKIDSLQISNCPVNELVANGTSIQNFNIERSLITNNKCKRMKVKYFTLTDVTLDQSINFSDVQVENLNTKNITKSPGLNLNLTGSNVKF